MTTQALLLLRLFSLIWDDEDKLNAIAESLAKLGEKHPEALQQFLEIYLAEYGEENVVDAGHCAICGNNFNFQLYNGRLVYRCENTCCEDHKV